MSYKFIDYDFRFNHMYNIKKRVGDYLPYYNMSYKKLYRKKKLCKDFSCKCAFFIVPLCDFFAEDTKGKNTTL